ncbi:MAG: tetratricopeptide repeat protein [Pirellulales bacterium]
MAALLLLPLASAGCNNFDAQARNAEGVRLFRQARYHDALRQFQEANYADARNVDAYYNLAATYHRLAGAEQSDTYQRQAENYYQMCLARDENHREAHRGLAVLLTDTGRSRAAFDLLNAWVARSPSSAPAKIELARLCQEFGDYQNAKSRLTEALAHDPGNTRAWTALGHLREQLGEHATALHDYQQSLAHNRLQPAVAARVASLRAGAAGRGGVIGYPRPRQDDTRLVEQPAGPRR